MSYNLSRSFNQTGMRDIAKRESVDMMMRSDRSIAVIVAGVLLYWFVFRWEKTPKRWCVMLCLSSKAAGVDSSHQSARC